MSVPTPDFATTGFALSLLAIGFETQVLAGNDWGHPQTSNLNQAGVA